MSFLLLSKSNPKPRTSEKAPKAGCCQRATGDLSRHPPSRAMGVLPKFLHHQTTGNSAFLMSKQTFFKDQASQHPTRKWKFNNGSIVVWILFYDLLDHWWSADRNSVITGLWEVVTANKHEGYVIAPFITSLGEDNAEEEMRLPVLTDFFTKSPSLTISRLVCCHKCSIE